MLEYRSETNEKNKIVANGITFYLKNKKQNKKPQWYGLHDDVPSYKDKQTD